MKCMQAECTCYVKEHDDRPGLAIFYRKINFFKKMALYTDHTTTKKLLTYCNNIREK